MVTVSYLYCGGLICSVISGYHWFKGTCSLPSRGWIITLGYWLVVSQDSLYGYWHFYQGYQSRARISNVNLIMLFNFHILQPTVLHFSMSKFVGCCIITDTFTSFANSRSLSISQSTLKDFTACKYPWNAVSCQGFMNLVVYVPV
jgi:hypothetical protein